MSELGRLAVVHEQILRVLREQAADYAAPVCSEALGEVLNLTPSYVREQAQVLQSLKLVGVRRGRGGGYFLWQSVPRPHGVGLSLASGQ